MRPNPTRRIAAALGLAVIFSSFTAAVPAMALPAMHAPFGEAPVWTDLAAASGQNLLAEVDESYRLSTDNGQTWQPSALDFDEDVYLSSVSDGKAVFIADDDTVSVLDLATNMKTEHAISGYDVWAADSQTAVGWDGIDGNPFVALPLAGGTPVALDEDYLDTAPAFNEYEDSVYMYPGTAVHLTDFFLDNKRTATDINVMPLNGDAGVDPFRVKGTVAYVGIHGDKVEWVKKVSTAVSLCTKPLAGGAEACQKLATLSSSSHSVNADRSGDVIRLELNGVEYIWEANNLKKVTYVGSYANFEGLGDPARPLVRVQNGTTGGIHQVLTGGSAPKLFDDLTIPVRPYNLDLSADKLVGVDRRDAGWVRSVSSAIGAESLLPGRASEVMASAGRMVLNGRDGLSFYDNGTLKSTTTAVSRLLDVSGPYALTLTGNTNSLRTATGTVTATSPQALFGSTYVGRGSDGKPFFRDLTKGSNELFTNYASLPGSWQYRGTRMWGDWVGIEMAQSDESTNVYVSSKRGAFQDRVYTGGRLVAMGDGVAVVGNESSGGYVLWNYLTDERTPFGDDDLSTPTLDDANRLAYADTDGLVVTGVPGMGQSAPILLGTVAAASFNPNAGAWTAGFDATKPLASGTLEITHQPDDGPMVIDRVIEIPATVDGSIRGVAWDGRTTEGAWAADGSYTWRLKVADATDPVKVLLAIDGQPAQGSITVKTANLGTVTAVTPKLSDTTPTVDQTITVVPGTWKPANTLFTYKWYRDSTLLKDTTAATYKVQPADAGHTLKVNVTGSCPGTDAYCRGYASAAKTSAVSSKVAKATITPAPVPVLDDTTPTVDQPVTGTIGTWGPDPVALSYQWYKVSSSGKATAIGGATAPVFNPTGSEVGYKLKLKVTGTRSGYNTKAVYSALTGKVAATTFTSTADPTITGSVNVGMPLTAVPGATDPGAKASFQWYRGTSAISGATASVYKTTSSDLGKLLKVRATYTRSGYASVVRYSAVTAPIAVGLVGVTPKLDDTTPAVGQVLRITDATGIGAWTPADATPAYQWYRDSSAIGGANGASYEVQAADVGHTIKVKLTGSKDDFASVAKTSAASSKVVKGVFTSKPQPTFEGDALVGQTLTAITAGWAPTPTSFTYVWYRSGAVISGKTQSTYELVGADLGKAIAVKVTAVRAGFTSASATSAPVTVSVAA